MENCLKLQNNKIRGESRSETTENMILQVDIGKRRKTSKDVEISESFSNVTFFFFFFSLSPTTVKFSNTPTHKNNSNNKKYFDVYLNTGWDLFDGLGCFGFLNNDGMSAL